MQFIYRFEAMTTPCEVVIFANSKDKADKIASEILHEIKRLEKKYNYFNPDSILTQINSRKIDILDKETLLLFKKAIEFYDKTDGVFDITIGTIKDLFLYSKDIESLEKEKVKLLKYTGCEHIKLEKNRIAFDNSYTKIDLGGFVKEYAVDKAVAILKKNRIKSALVNLGGDVFAIGKKPNKQRFKIGIKDPFIPTKIKIYLEIENQALTTSASYERFKKIEDKNFSHIISKNQNMKSPNSVSVVSKTCLESGTYSTSLMIHPYLKVNAKVYIF
jgi:thiamine biosynthesis lipoprotein